MEQNQPIPDMKKIGGSFTEAWFSQEFALLTGLLHLTYDGQWHSLFISGDSCRILECGQEDFLKQMLDMVAFTEYRSPGQPVRELLQKLVLTGGTCAFIIIRPRKNDEIQYVKGTLVAEKDANGLLNVYGQLADVSGLQMRDSHFQVLAEEYQSSLQISGRSFYRYLIEGRKAIIPSDIAKCRGIPQVIENLPDWNIQCGRIAPQSIDTWLGVFDAIDRGEERGAEDVIFLVRNGEITRRCRVEFARMTDESGKPVGALVSHEDITDKYEKDYRQAMDRAGLLQVAQMTFPEILSNNLTRGTYRVIQYYSATTLGMPREGRLEDMLSLCLDNVAPEDRAAFSQRFSLENLRKAVQEGVERVQLAYRRRGVDGSWHWMETISVRQGNPYDDDVIMFAVSRSIDEEKAKELRLAEQLRQQSEELKLTMSQMGKHISYYDVPTGVLTTLPSTAKKFGVPTVMEDFPESFLANPPKGYPAAAGQILRTFMDAIRRGETSGCCEYPTITADGESVWLQREFATIFDDKNNPIRTVIASQDITQSYLQQEENRQLKENERILRLNIEEQTRRNEQIFLIVSQHSNRILYSYDLKERTTSPWDLESKRRDILSQLYAGRYSEEKLAENPCLMNDSVESVKYFFRDIYSGKPSGDVNVHVKLSDEQPKWYHFKYSSLFEGDTPTIALISVADITDKYEQQVSHMLRQQSLERETGRLCVIEADLTDDRLEKHSGENFWNHDAHIQYTKGASYTAFLQDCYFGLIAEDCVNACVFYSRENLLSQYNQGFKHLENLWHIERNRQQVWVTIEADLITDPLSGHIKLFARMLDVTAEQEELKAVNQRADYDGMTGLLRKRVGEEQVKKYLAAGSEPGGVLILLDLDDLKGTNDTLGHKQGDAAIVGFANAISEHFRRDDVLVRAGGDEFMVFLPGAAKNVDAVAASLQRLLRKVSGIFIGEHNERNIHCSVGCAIERPGKDTYDSLFKRADTALYHVKRNGKNNLAFYVPEMERADYEFRSQKLLGSDKPFDTTELRHLVSALAGFCPLVLSANLSANTYHLMEETNAFGPIPESGCLDDFMKLSENSIHPEDTADYQNLSRKALLQAYEQGSEHIQRRFRLQNQDTYRWMECMIFFYINSCGDICDFTMLHWLDQENQSADGQMALI